MSSNDPDHPSGDQPDTGTGTDSGTGSRPDRARQLFGHKGGGRPWDAPRQVEETGRQRSVAASAPYPDAPTYAPRTSPTADPSGSADPVEDDDTLTLLHPNYRLQMRISAIIVALVLFGVGAGIDAILRSAAGQPFGLALVPATLLALFIAIPLPARRYRNRGYQISDDRLRVVRGVMWHSDTVVPFGRVQHIDVDQGPVERALGIATLTLHTAGSHNASVSLPGLGHDLAVEMREAIRAHIKRESV